MPRRLRDTRLDTRTARLKLSARHEPYWRLIGEGRHLGYRRGVEYSAWIARYRGDDGRYLKITLGRPDDIEDADGATVLSFGQAQESARTWFSARSRDDALGIQTSSLTVADIMKDYLDWYSHHRKGLVQTRSVVQTWITPQLGEIEISKLTALRIRKWHESIAASHARVRSKKGGKQKYRNAEQDLDTKRRRKSTANRCLTVLKAALNHALTQGALDDDSSWRFVKPFRGVDAPRIRHLSVEECTRLIKACEKDFRHLVRAALLTGCRYGELAKLHLRNVDVKSGTILIQDPKVNRSYTVNLTDEGIEFFKDVTKGLTGNTLVFKRSTGATWKSSDQQRPMHDACVAAGIEPPISFNILRHTHASLLAMAGAHPMIIAHQLGHADTRMVEKHYGHLLPSFIRDEIRKRLPQFS
jgi:integrase